MSAPAPETHYIVEEVVVGRGFPADSGPEISVGFGNGKGHVLLFTLDDPQAWAMASRVLALLGREPATPEELARLAAPPAGGDDA